MDAYFIKIFLLLYSLIEESFLQVLYMTIILS